MTNEHRFTTSIRIGSRFVGRYSEWAASPEEAAKSRIAGLVSDTQYDNGTILVASDTCPGCRYESAVFDWERREVPATKEIVLS